MFGNRKKRVSPSAKGQDNSSSLRRPRQVLAQMPAEAVARRAYEKYIARGGRHGDDWRDWFEAERELTAEAQRN